MYKTSSAGARLEIARQGHKLVAEVLKNSRTDQSIFKSQLIKKTIVNDLKIEDKNEIVAGEQCICGRKPKTLVCIRCKMFTYGRIAKKCSEHKNVTFLMDFITCPNCLGPNEYLRGVDIDKNTCKDINLKMMESPNKCYNLSDKVDEYDEEL